VVPPLTRLQRGSQSRIQVLIREEIELYLRELRDGSDEEKAALTTRKEVEL
jgi:hypothetical protein